jgi:hypothetical protein
LLQRETQPAPVESIQRLQSRKAAVSKQIAAQRAEARFETMGQETSSNIDVDQPPVAVQETPDQSAYTERLLRAKKKIWEDR